MKAIIFVIGFGMIAVLVWWWRASSQKKQHRASYIRAFTFPFALRDKLSSKYPHLSGEQLDQVVRALRQYFLICLEAGAASGKSSVGMPSKVVDEAWHAFILMSREYTAFCQKAFGRYLHHTPESQMKVAIEKPLINALHQIRTRPGGATGWAMLAGIPLIFAIDKAFAIPDGYYYDAGTIDALDEKRKAWLASSGGDTGVSTSGSYDTSCGPSGASCGDAGSGGSSCASSSGGDGGGSSCGGGGCGSS
jgi:hypothetical protein